MAGSSAGVSRSKPPSTASSRSSHKPPSKVPSPTLSAAPSLPVEHQEPSTSEEEGGPTKAGGDDDSGSGSESGSESASESEDEEAAPLGSVQQTYRPSVPNPSESSNRRAPFKGVAPSDSTHNASEEEEEDESSSAESEEFPSDLDVPGSSTSAEEEKILMRDRRFNLEEKLQRKMDRQSVREHLAQKKREAELRKKQKDAEMKRARSIAEGKSVALLEKQKGRASRGTSRADSGSEDDDGPDYVSPSPGDRLIRPLPSPSTLPPSSSTDQGFPDLSAQIQPQPGDKMKKRKPTPRVNPAGYVPPDRAQTAVARPKRRAEDEAEDEGVGGVQPPPAKKSKNTPVEHAEEVVTVKQPGKGKKKKGGKAMKSVAVPSGGVAPVGGGTQSTGTVETHILRTPPKKVDKGKARETQLPIPPPFKSSPRTRSTAAAVAAAEKAAAPPALPDAPSLKIKLRRVPTITPTTSTRTQTRLDEKLHAEEALAAKAIMEGELEVQGSPSRKSKASPLRKGAGRGGAGPSNAESREISQGVQSLQQAFRHQNRELAELKTSLDDALETAGDRQEKFNIEMLVVVRDLQTRMLAAEAENRDLKSRLRAYGAGEGGAEGREIAQDGKTAIYEATDRLLRQLQDGVVDFPQVPSVPYESESWPRMATADESLGRKLVIFDADKPWKDPYNQKMASLFFDYAQTFADHIEMPSNIPVESVPSFFDHAQAWEASLKRYFETQSRKRSKARIRNINTTKADLDKMIAEAQTSGDVGAVEKLQKEFTLLEQRKKTAMETADRGAISSRATANAKKFAARRKAHPIYSAPEYSCMDSYYCQPTQVIHGRERETGNQRDTIIWRVPDHTQLFSSRFLEIYDEVMREPHEAPPLRDRGGRGVINPPGYVPPPAIPILPSFLKDPLLIAQAAQAWMFSRHPDHWYARNPQQYDITIAPFEVPTSTDDVITSPWCQNHPWFAGERRGEKGDAKKRKREESKPDVKKVLGGEERGIGGSPGKKGSPAKSSRVKGSKKREHTFAMPGQPASASRAGSVASEGSNGERGNREQSAGSTSGGEGRKRKRLSSGGGVTGLGEEGNPFTSNAQAGPSSQGTMRQGMDPQHQQPQGSGYPQQHQQYGIPYPPAQGYYPPPPPPSRMYPHSTGYVRNDGVWRHLGPQSPSPSGGQAIPLSYPQVAPLGYPSHPQQEYALPPQQFMGGNGQYPPFDPSTASPLGYNTGLPGADPTLAQEHGTYSPSPFPTGQTDVHSSGSRAPAVMQLDNLINYDQSQGQQTGGEMEQDSEGED